MSEPTKAWIDEQKAKYGKIYQIVIGGDVYIYHGLNRAQMHSLQKEFAVTNETSPQAAAELGLKFEDKIVSMCVIWPEDFATRDQSKIPAGVITVLAQAIQEASGYNVQEQPVEL